MIATGDFLHELADIHMQRASRRARGRLFLDTPIFPFDALLFFHG
jgi:hypothetical protein